MTTIDTTVEKDLKDLKDAVSAVVKANKAWLSALEAFFENIDPKTTDTTQLGIINKIVGLFPSLQSGQIDQAVRLVLDDVGFVQSTDKRLDARISRSDPTPESLGRAVVETEAYLVLTHEAFTNLVSLSSYIVALPTQLDKNLKKLFAAADSATKGLNTLVKTLLQSTSGSTTVVVLPPTEPTGADLLLGRNLNPCSEFFLGLIPAGSKPRTLALLEGQRLTLSDSQIKSLTNSWGRR